MGIGATTGQSMKILIIGNAAVDIINHVASTPKEDDEIRALSQTTAMGGNSANTAIVLSMLGHDVSWAGSLADDANSQLIIHTFEHYHVDVTHAQIVIGGKTPTSYITLSKENGCRTIVHYRDLPELSFDVTGQRDLNTYQWVHFEGRNIESISQMINQIKSSTPDLPISLEVEKPRPGIESLFSSANLLLFSHHYAREKGYKNAKELLTHISRSHPQQIACCTWGAKGAFGTYDGNLFEIKPERLKSVTDTIGAGDVYNAGVISSLLVGNSPQTAMEQASRLAEKKCTQTGFSGLKQFQS
jgi:ketohexokinase